MPQFVTIAAGNGANSGRTVRLLRTEARTVELEGVGPVDLVAGVVDVDGLERRYSVADLTPTAEVDGPTAAGDPVADLSERLLTEFGRTFHEALGVADAFESDQERLFSVIVEAAKLYCQVGVGEDGASIASHIGCTADALVENLEVVFEEELAR